MSGITSTGLFSGIDANQLIEQLIQVESRPKVFAQRRLLQLQQQQASYLELNGLLNNLKSAASQFRTQRSFQAKKATTSDDSVLTVSASTRAQPGTYRFVVDRLVSSQQVLSRGFSDRDQSAIGLESLTIENAAARLDRETELADLNDGQGIDRGKLSINGVEIDLSRAGTVNDVLNAINNADGLTGVTASVRDGGLVIEGVTSVANVAGDQTADSLGLTTAGGGSLVGSTLTGATLFGLNGFTALSSLNDGRGVSINPVKGSETTADFTVTVGGTEARVRIGEIVEFQTDDEGNDVLETVAGPASNVSTVVARIEDALEEAGLTDVTVSLDTANGRFQIVDALGRDIDIASVNSQTAEDLGIAGSYTGGTATGSRVLAGMNTTLISSLNGGAGLDGDGLVSFDTADGSSFTVDVSNATTLEELVTLINEDAGNAGAVTVSLNSAGNGLSVLDNTAGGGDLVISGTGGSDTATSLGLAGTYTDGVANGSNMQLAWVSLATRLDTIADGQGVGEGTFRITDSFGNTQEFSVDDDDLTLNAIVSRINSSDTINVIARINDTGDGLVIEEDTGAGTGAAGIRIEDVEGVVATRLKIAGEAGGTGADNFIDGSFETTIEFDASDTLNDIVNKINNEDPSATVVVVNDGSGSAPFRLSFGAGRSGSEGRFILDTGGFDLGLQTLDQGNDARVFYGASDPADGILLTGSDNTLDRVISGVTIDLTGTSDGVVEVNVTQTLEEVESQITALLDSYNEVVTRIDTLTRFDPETKARGALLGDGTALNLRNSLARIALGRNQGFNSTIDTLAEVGITVGSGGQLEFDQERFREAWDNDPEAVEDLFTRRDIDPDSGVQDLGNGITARDPLARTEFTALGIVSQLEQFADDYITSIGGVLTERNNAVSRQIRLQEQRIADFDVRLESKRQTLAAQFLAMEQAIAQFQSQGSTLSLLG
ncbi:MAG: flagellar filament capping protein FliD [Phycisphaerales bacterium JB040]